jgi:hypothetical protein
MPKLFYFPNGETITLNSGDLPLNNTPFRVDSKATDVKPKPDNSVDDNDDSKDPIERARAEQNDRIEGKKKTTARQAGIEPDNTGLAHNDSSDPITWARELQMSRITSNNC